MSEFSSFIGAVKKSERSDQYYILAAMYCLSAHLNPVTATQVKNFLALPLGSADVPTNVNSSLRSYQGLVEPSQKGPPMRWTLTPGGLNRLRKLSGLQLKSELDAKEYETDIGIICALEFPEFAAVTNVFNENPWTELS